MFKIVRSIEVGVKVVSDENFDVNLHNRGVDGLGVIYHANGRKVMLNAFSDSHSKRQNRILIEVPRKLKWMIPDNTDFMTKEEMLDVLNRIQQALKFQGMEVEFVFYGNAD